MLLGGGIEAGTLMCVTSGVFVVALGALAFLQKRKHGVRAVACRTLSLMGLFSLAVLLPLVVRALEDFPGIGFFALLAMLFVVLLAAIWRK